MLFRLEREVTALNAITEQYTKALAEHLNRRAQVARLRVHVKQNILYYMQAIWSHEPPDQRFFRLHDVRVPVLERSRDRLHLGDMVPDRGFLAARAEDTAAARGKPPRQLYPFEVRAELSPELRTTTLAQVADLDDFLGFKGNYMVFRLKRPNALTDLMMQPYVVAGFDALTDPDELGNWTLEEFSRYVHCLGHTLGQEAFEAVRPQLLQQYERLLASPRRNGDVVSLPTGSLFIEALPARHSLLEEFKARHRAVDVKRAQAEVRRAEMENVRLAARILAGEREDPNIEKKVVIEGGPSSLFVPADDT